MIKNKIMLMLAIVYMAIIFYLSSLSRPLPFALKHNTDKVIHFVEYGVLGFLLAYVFKDAGVKRFVLVGWIAATLYGLSDEFHQSFVPMRDASVYDLIADSIGSFVGAIIAYNLLKFRHKNDKSI